jgi:hypothetical protein
MYHDKEDSTIQIEYYALSELGRQFRGQLRAYRTYHLTLKTLQSGKTSPESNDARSQLEEKAKLPTEILQAQFGEYIEEDPRILMPIEFDAAIRRALNTKKPRLNWMHSFIILHIQVLHLLFMSSPRTSYQLRPLHRGTCDIPTASREHSLSRHVPGFTEAVRDLQKQFGGEVR